MRGAPAPMTEQQAAARRKGVRRTVLLFACIALAVYAAFVATGLWSHGVAR